MSPNTRVLVLAYLFPPSASVGARRIASFCKYLPEYGVQPEVVTVQERYYERCDSSVNVPAGLRVVRTNQRATLISVYGSAKRLWRRRPEAPPPGISELDHQGHRLSLRQELVTRLVGSELERGWRAPAVRAGGRLLSQGGFGAILSSGPPWTAHLAARQLKSRSHLPWLADFRDPWAGSGANSWSAWRCALEDRLESGCVHDADVIICNTGALRDNFAERYPELSSRLMVITNGFDDLDASPPAAARKNKVVCLHLGQLYGDRRIDAFCRAVERFLSAGTLRAEEFQALLVGNTNEAFLQTAARNAPNALACGALTFRASVPKTEAQALLQEANLLLLFQGGYRMQVPAKFYEYLQTGKPMFAVTERGELTALMERTGCGRWADPGDDHAVAEGLLDALALPTLTPQEAQQRWAWQFHFRALSGELARRIQALNQTEPATGAAAKPAGRDSQAG